MKYLSILLFGVFLVCSGCAFHSSGTSYSAIDSSQYIVALEQLSADASATIAQKYAPGHTVLFVVPAKDTKNNSAFAMHLENALRTKGFQIAESGKKVVYLVDFIDKGNMYLSVKISDGYAFSCLYHYGEQAVIKQGESFYFGE